MIHEYLLTTQAVNPQQISCCFWDYKNGAIRQYYKHGGSITSRTLDTAGLDYIVAAEQNKPLLHVWPINSQEPLKNVRLVLPDSARAVAVYSKGGYLAAGIGAKVYLWELSSGKLLAVQQVHYQNVSCVKFAVGGFLIAAGEDGMITTYNLVDLIGKHRTGQQVEPLYKRMDHSLPITDLHVGKFGFKSRFATTSSDQTLRIYQLIDGQLLLTLIFDSPLTAVIVDSAFHNVYAGDSKGGISKFSLSQPPPTVEHHVDSTNKFEGHKGKIISLDLNVTNNYLASCSEDSNILLWDVKTRQIFRRIEIKSIPTNVKFQITSEHIFDSNYQASVLISTLERNLEADASDTTVGTIQRDECNLRGPHLKRKLDFERRTVQELQVQVANLQKINRELFVKLQKFNKV